MRVARVDEQSYNGMHRPSVQQLLQVRLGWSALLALRATSAALSLAEAQRLMLSGGEGFGALVVGLVVGALSVVGCGACRYLLDGVYLMNIASSCMDGASAW